MKMIIPVTPPPLEVLGITLSIVWDEFILGSSFFVPCIDDRRIAEAIRRAARARGMKVHTVARVENTLWGVRVWRIA